MVKRCIFFQVDNKVTRTTLLVPFCCLHWPRSCFTNCLLWLWKPHCICLEQNSIGKRPKDFEASDFPSCMLNNAHFFWNQSQKSKKFYDVRKSEDVQQAKWYTQKVLLLWGFCIPSFRAVAHAIDKQSGTCRRYLPLQGLYVASVKTTTYVCNRFDTSFCTKDHKTQLAISCNILLHQAARGEGKNSLRKRRDILVSDRDQQRSQSSFFIIIIT